MLSTEKGMSLVALIIAITLTSLLGVGITSFMSAKQQSLVPQLNSFKAYTIAQAGIEFAIRYAYDNKYDHDLLSTTNPNHFGTPKTVHLDVDGLPYGRFTISYNSAQDILTSLGIYEVNGVEVARRTIVLRRFSSYYGYSP